MRMLKPTNFLGDPNWWPSHLHETVASGADGDCGPYLYEAFNTTIEDMNHFWTEVLQMDKALGSWPQIHIGLPRGHVLSVVYFGTPRYSVEYRYGTPSGESILLSEQGLEPTPPGFRWVEVKAISSLVPHISPLALLVLAPAASVSTQEEDQAKMEIHWALTQLGYSSAACIDLAGAVARGLHTDMEWMFDESYGWVTYRKYSMRCPTQPLQGLEGLSQSDFQALKKFTNELCLNP
jgi:hypothetical protein